MTVAVQNVCHGAGLSVVASSEKREYSVDTVNGSGNESSDHSDRPVRKVAAGVWRAFGAA